MSSQDGLCLTCLDISVSSLVSSVSRCLIIFWVEWQAVEWRLMAGTCCTVLIKHKNQQQHYPAFCTERTAKTDSQLRTNSVSIQIPSPVNLQDITTQKISIIWKIKFAGNKVQIYRKNPSNTSHPMISEGAPSPPPVHINSLQFKLTIW